MIQRILALGGIGISMAFGQNPGAQNPGAQSAATAKQNQLFAYDVTIDPKFKAPKTPWGEPDLQGIWPLNHLIRVGLQRNKMYGDRLYKTDEEFSGGGGRGGARGGRGGGRAGQPANDTPPVADTSDRAMRQTSLIVDPPDGQFPALTDYGKKLQ